MSDSLPKVKRARKLKVKQPSVWTQIDFTFNDPWVADNDQSVPLLVKSLEDCGETDSPDTHTWTPIVLDDNAGTDGV